MSNSNENQGQPTGVSDEAESVSAEAKSVLAQRWTVEQLNFYGRLMEGNQCIAVVNGNMAHVALQLIADAHNASVLAQEAGETKGLGEPDARADHVKTVLQKTLNLLLSCCGWEHNYRPDGVELSMTRPKDVQEVEMLCAEVLSSNFNVVLTHPVSQNPLLAQEKKEEKE